MKKELLKMIIDRTEKSASDWKKGAEGNRSFLVHQELYDQIGKTEFINGAKELQRQGLLKIEWEAIGVDIRRIRYSLKDLAVMYEMSGIRPKFQMIEENMTAVENLLHSVKGLWIKEYLIRCMKRLEQGKIPQEFSKRDALFRCLKVIDGLKEPLYKRVFSKYCLGDSKLFENSLESVVLSIARKYHEDIEEGMNNTQILSQLLIEEYSQELAVKGPLRISVNGQEINLGQFCYGAVLNSQMLVHAKPLAGQNIKRILTIENKANYMAMPYDEEAVIIYSHGFFTPKEREFLIRMRNVLCPVTQYLHSGDLDYGGILIYRYIKQKIFPDLMPYQMDAEIYHKYEKYTVKMEPETLKKLKKMQMNGIPELTEIKELLSREGKGLEQESFLLASDETAGENET